MDITVFGCGRWGSFLAWYLHSIGGNVTLYGRNGSSRLAQLEQTRSNGMVVLDEKIKLCSDLEQASESEIFVVALASQQLRPFLGSIPKTKGKTLVLCMKGLEISTGKRLSVVARECVEEDTGIAVWLGPGHPQDFVKGIPNCMVIDSQSESLTHRLVDSFSGNLIRFYYGDDLIGNELGAAAKNVVGIAAGMLDGLGMSSLKGGLMARAPKEIARLIKSQGGDENSAYGLCHLGDYEATLFSPHSNNRRFGEMIIKGEKYDALAEGYYSVKALQELGEKCGVDLPICRAVYRVLYQNSDPFAEVEELFNRKIKKEI